MASVIGMTYSSISTKPHEYLRKHETHQTDSLERKDSSPERQLSTPETRCRKRTWHLPDREWPVLGVEQLTLVCLFRAIIPASFPNMEMSPARMNASATSAVVLSFPRLRMRASSKKMITCYKMKHWMLRSFAQPMIARTKDRRFSKTKMTYAETKPS